jgi:hypothetical protein
MRSIALILVTVAGLIGCAEHEIDAEMERLCREDGGTRVFISVPLAVDQFDKYGQPNFYHVREGIQPEDNLGRDYRLDFQFVEIKRIRNVILSKSTTKIFRRSDDALLGQSVRYSSGGGLDRIPLSEGPRSECPKQPPADLVRSVFVLQK